MDLLPTREEIQIICLASFGRIKSYNVPVKDLQKIDFDHIPDFGISHNSNKNRSKSNGKIKEI